MTLPCVLFDAFGTLIKIQNGTHPYRRIIKIGMEQGRRPLPDDAEILLSQPLGIQEAALRFGISVSPAVISELENDLRRELLQMEPYDDGVEAVALLQASGVPVGICSNLAKPYAFAVERLYPSIKLHAYSFEAGAVKPSLKMYSRAAAVIGAASPSDISFIGDSRRCDREGPRNYGMKGYLLCRTGSGDYASLIDFTNDVLERQGLDRRR